MEVVCSLGIIAFRWYPVYTTRKAETSATCQLIYAS